MKDGYRYFVSRPTAEDGNPVPVESSDPSYFRIPGDTIDGRLLVEFWCVDEWLRSIIQPFHAHIDDALGSGATIREVLEEEIPHA